MNGDVQDVADELGVCDRAVLDALVAGDTRADLEDTDDHLAALLEDDEP